MHSTIQEILVSKLPRLGKLTFWCEVKIDISWEEWNYILWGKDWRSWDNINSYEMVWNNYITFNVQSWYENCWCETYKILEIIGHPFTHADILEVLGEDWAITGSWELLFYPRWHTSMVFWMDMWPQWIEKGITLPRVLSDLSLPEYEETTKQLIQLLTK